ncbi:MAG TPA: PAS domain S-box protein, partial [Vicinamibacterales bacterium]|nr:PAS domain S-box protein [Vicinamibacterales bacterium]
MTPSAPLPPLLQFAPVAVASVALDGRILDVNHALLTASGYSRDELIARPFSAFMGPIDDAEIRGHFAALAAGSADTYRVERQFRTKAGDIRDVDLSVSLVRDAEGKPEQCLAVLQDVTAHKRAVEDAARRAAELEAVIHSLPAAVFIGHEHGITMANRISLEQFGFASTDELHRHMAEVSARLQNRDALTGERIDWEDEPFVRALHGEHVDRELISRHLGTGEDVVHRVIAAPVRLGGRTIGAVAISANITDRKRTEEALKLSEARYRAIMEQSPFSVQVLSPDGTTLEVNAAWERLWGVRLEQIGGYNILEDQQLVDRGLMPGIRRGFAGEACDLPPTRYDPNETIPDVSARPESARWVRAVIYPIKDERGRVREVVLIHEDVSDRVRAEADRKRIAEEREELLRATQRAYQEAEAASRIKDEFLATLSHELRTPLNAVIGWTRILRGGDLEPRVAHALDVIDRNAWAQARMIDDLLDVSRIATGNIRLA